MSETTLLICTLSLDSLEADTVAIRLILYSSVETVEDYYNTLVGVKEITVEVVSVPLTFQIELVGPVGDPALTFPAYDIALPTTSVPAYRALVQRAIEDEHERIRLGVRTAAAAATEVAPSLSKERQQLFAILHQTASALESVELGGNVPTIVAWMLSPCHIPTRHRHGIKFITDPVMGSKWDALVGTAIFPDFIISRRITSASWTFQHVATTKMLTAMVEWWATAHVRTEDLWIHSAETELDALLELFRTKGVPTVYHAERMDPVRTTLLEIEETVLGNSEVYARGDLVQFSTAIAWRAWIDRMLRSKGVLLESNVDVIQCAIQRWMRDGWGLRKECLPAPSASSLLREAWTALAAIRPPDEECVQRWIRLVNINDPMYTIHVRQEQKQQIVDDWVPVALSFLKAAHPLIRAKSMATYAWVQRWILKFVPVALFKQFMIPKRIFPSITAAGYVMIHSTGGYCFVGLEVPAAEEELVPWGQDEVD